MRKDEMLQLITMMLDDFNKRLGKEYLVQPEAHAKITLEYIKPAFQFLDNIHRNEYQEVKRIYDLQDPSQWVNYEAFGMTDFPEWIMLEKARSSLRRALVSRKRPAYFKKTAMQELTNEQ